MQINSIQSVQSYNSNINSFKGANKNQDYENPINRQTEKNLAVLSSVGTSLLTGATAFGLSTCMTSNKKVSGIAGAVTAGLTLLLTLPSALYNASVGSFVRQEEADVFSRQKQAQKQIYENVNEEIKDEDVSLDDKIKHYTTVAMADKGNGVMIKGA